MTNVNQITCKHGACYNTDYTLDDVTLGAPFPLELAEKAMAFPFRSQDVLVASYPRSGEALLYDIVWLLMNEADIDGATNIPLSRRLPLLELTPLERGDAEPTLERMHVKEAPRVMCTHLPYSLLGEAIEKGKPRVIVVMRDPKELVLSLYCSYRQWPGRELPSFTYFFETFVKTGRLLFGNHVDHLLGYWSRTKEKHMLVLKSADFLYDVEDTVLQISHFLEKDLTPKQIHSIVKFMSAQASGNVRQPPVLDTVLGVRLFEADLGDIGRTSSGDEEEREEDEEKGKTESTEVEIHSENGKKRKGDGDVESEAAFELAPTVPPMEVEFVCVPKQLQLSSEQAEYIDDQCKTRLEPAGLFF